MSEWIQWGGGRGMPVDGEVLVDVKFGDGVAIEGQAANNWSWGHTDIGSGNIVAYRLATQEEAYEETDKPIGDSALNVQIGGDHYKHFQIQPITFINANEMDFLQGSIIKYISRHKLKGGKADVEKAIHFCKLILELQYAEAK